MVTCNVQRFLAEAIESILDQTFRDFEFIIVDFGSTDDSKSIISSYAAKDSRIKFHEIPRCSLATARNAAFFIAQGRYIAVMDADDVSVPDRLAWEIEFMERHPKVGLLGGATESIDTAGKPLIIHSHNSPTAHNEIKSALADRCPFCHSTVLIRGEAFVLVGGYRAAFAQAEDYDLWIRIAEHFEVANLRQVVLKYRIHPHQISMRKRKQQRLCILAAQVSAKLRTSGKADLFDTLAEITPEVLAELGVTEPIQQASLASDYGDWVRNMIAEILESSDWEYAESREIADLWLTAARLYWGQEQFLSSVRAVGRAVIVRPAVVGRPFKPLLRRMGLAQLTRSRDRDKRAKAQ